MLDLGVGVELCWAHSPAQKGEVENLVGWVKGSSFEQRRFVGDEDLRHELAQWRREVNAQRPARATRILPAVRLAQEQPWLRRLRNREPAWRRDGRRDLSPTTTVALAREGIVRKRIPPEFALGAALE
jgi:hypothetical protein